MRILVEGWRFLPQSFAVLNQFQLLEMLKRPGLEVFHRDVPYLGRHWPSTRGLFDAAAEETLRGIPGPPPDLCPDALLRVGQPFNLEPSNARRTAAILTTEWGIMQQKMLRLMRVPSIRAAHAGTDVVIITPSRWSREGLLRSGADPERVVVVPHGVDPAIYRPLDEAERAALRKELQWEGSFIFLNIGLASLNKGYQLLLKAFAALLERHPHAALVWKTSDKIGSGQELIQHIAQKFLTRAETARVLKRLAYVNKPMAFTAMARLYQAADAYVSPYMAEGFNMPVLEAAACGLPVICTKGGPTDDFTRADFALHIDSRLTPVTVEGEKRLIVRPNDEHLLSLMETVIEEPAYAAQARKAGPRFVAQRYTWKHVVDQLLAVLQPPALCASVAGEQAAYQ
jgi:glycosyltransferase involved in cell wall biosynthesis